LNLNNYYRVEISDSKILETSGTYVYPIRNDMRVIHARISYSSVLSLIAKIWHEQVAEDHPRSELTLNMFYARLRTDYMINSDESMGRRLWLCKHVKHGHSFSASIIYHSMNNRSYYS